MDNNEIKTDKEYRVALLEIESLMKAKANTPAGERLNKLVTLVEDYEEDLELVKVVKERLDQPTVEVDI